MTETERPLLLASVVLLQLRDYSHRPVAEQARLSAQLDAVLAVLLPDIPDHERIVMEGNGCAAVAVLGNPPVALRFAERALAANNADLNLSIGIDHGPVDTVAGETGNVLAGDVVTSASVTASFAADYGLLTSGNFRTALAEAAPGTESALLPVGLFSDSTLRSYAVFRLDHEAHRVRKRRRVLTALGAALLLLATASMIRIAVPDRPRPLATIVDIARYPVLEHLLGNLHGKP